MEYNPCQNRENNKINFINTKNYQKPNKATKKGPRFEIPLNCGNLSDKSETSESHGC